VRCTNPFLNRIGLLCRETKKRAPPNYACAWSERQSRLPQPQSRTPFTCINRLTDVIDSPLPPPPRAVKLKRGALISQVVLGLLMLGIFGIAPYKLSTLTSRLNTLRQSGKVTSGKVIEAWVSHGKSSVYHLTVEFPRDDPRPAVTRVVPQALYYRYPEQSTIPILSMPNDPSDLEAGEVDQARIEEFKQPFVFVLALYGSIFGGLGILLQVGIWRERALLMSGEVVGARVTSSRYIGGKSNSTIVEYSYETQFGERTGKGRTTGQKTSSYPSGLEIPVIYKRDDDKVSQPVEMFQYVQLR
jgi:hypothetical protein